MPAARDDYLMRLISQVAAAIRRLRSQLDDGATDEVLSGARDEIGRLLGPQRMLLERLDPASARQIVGNADTVRAWSDLLLLQADAEEAMGHEPASLALRQRAEALAPAPRTPT